MEFEFRTIFLYTLGLTFRHGVTRGNKILSQMAIFAKASFYFQRVARRVARVGAVPRIRVITADVSSITRNPSASVRSDSPGPVARTVRK